jgi:ABC-type branched-subunit amino acid transport system substrate-binding protein
MKRFDMMKFLCQFSVTLLNLFFIVLISAGLAGAQDVIKVGVPAPYSGPAAEKGEHLKYGILVAQEEINAKGGILGKKVELVFADTEAKPEVGVSAYEKLIARDKVHFIVGEVNSDVALATLDVVAKYKIPTIYVIPASDELGKKVKSDPQKYATVFMTDIPVSVMQSGAFIWLDEAASAGKVKAKEKTYALIVEDSSWGRIVGETWKSNMEKIRWKNVLFEVTPFKESEYMPILTKVKNLNPDLIKIEITSLPAGVAITKQINELGIKSHVFGGYYQKTIEFPKMAGSFADGSFNIKEPFALEWEKKVQKRFPKADPIASMYSYDSLHILANALTKSKSLDSEKVTKALLETDYKGVFMRTVFDPETHFAKFGKDYKLFGIAMFKDGKLQLIWPGDYAQMKF